MMPSSSGKNQWVADKAGIEPPPQGFFGKLKQPAGDEEGQLSRIRRSSVESETPSQNSERRAQIRRQRSRRGSLGLEDLAPTRAQQRRRSSQVSIASSHRPRRRRSSIELMIDELSTTAYGSGLEQHQEQEQEELGAPGNQRQTRRLSLELGDLHEDLPSSQRRPSSSATRRRSSIELMIDELNSSRTSMNYQSITTLKHRNTAVTSVPASPRRNGTSTAGPRPTDVAVAVAATTANTNDIADNIPRNVTGDGSKDSNRGYTRPARATLPAHLALRRRSSALSIGSGLDDSDSGSLCSFFDGTSVGTLDLEKTLSELYSRKDKKGFVTSIKNILQKTTLVLEVTQLLSESHSLEDLLAKLTSTVITKLGVERCTIFLHDEDTDELYTRASEDETMKEIRFPSGLGIAGQAFTDRTAFLIPDAYQDPRFNPDVDRRTGFKTKTILCTPIWKSGGKDDCDATVIGVAQAVNKSTGNFTEFDLTLLENMITPCAHALINAKLNEDNNRMMNVMVEISKTMSRYQSLDALLPRLTSMITTSLGVERCTIFLYDNKTDELYAMASEDAFMKEIRFLSNAGIAGEVFTEQKTLIIPDAYADPRFNQSIDKQTGFLTRSIMCAPIWKASAETSAPAEVSTETWKRMFPTDRTVIGVAQVVNKAEGSFTEFDQKLLQTVTTQAAHALVNAQLTDEVIRIKNYNERMLESIGDGILSVDPDGIIVKVNRSFAKMLDIEDETGEQLIGMASSVLFRGDSAWISEGIKSVARKGQSEVHMDRKLRTMGNTFLDVNVTIVPLTDPDGEQIGCIVQMDDMTREKRMRSTMSRYMNPKVAERLLEEGAEELGGKLQTATVLFSDIRSFTSISEVLGPTKTVQMLNDYFSSMTEIVFDYNGSLDKFIGDAIMAVYGVPFESKDDADNAVLSAIEMQLEMAIFNSSRQARGDDVTDLKIGIGINTGEVVSGNIGSMKRMEYTAIGDAVNLAARLESACKTFSADILISEFTVARISKKYILREVDRICVKGKTQPVAIYEVLDHLVHVDKSIIATMPLYSDALKSYRCGNFSSAIKQFSLVLQKRPHDGASKLLLSRCEELHKNPPEDWQGVWQMETK